ncbi:hypothetical protein AB0L88_04000 [Saccharopolyspora shandongensis]|uniref:hypothetical protein n=1 Tax=Saccharopolyspora shandongensis TaxID=418495 RepID=UPI00115FDE55|nr:hypothetical protein [Saccharopolyspora shandongensis]
MISHSEVLARSEAASDALPLLTIDEFFVGNTDEESLAPNQWGHDRPPLAEIEQRLRALAAEPGVEWVRVQLDDTHEVDEIAAEAIAICTDREPDDIEELLDSEYLQADGVIEGYAISDPGDEPAVPAGSHVLSLVWD